MFDTTTDATFTQAMLAESALLSANLTALPSDNGRVPPQRPAEARWIAPEWLRERASHAHKEHTEETAETHLRRILDGKCASLPVRLHESGDFGRETGRGIDLVPGWRLGRRFASWWRTAVARPEIVGSSKNQVSPAVAARLMRAGVWATEVARLPWTGGDGPRIDGLRSFRAARRLARKLGRRAVGHTSRSGLTRAAPALLLCVSGRDLVRLARLGPGFLRWVCARVERDYEARHRLVPSVRSLYRIDEMAQYHQVWQAIQPRIDWAEMAQYHQVWQAIQPAIPGLRAKRVPMWQWGVAEAAPPMPEE